jgi:phage-related minor tail protein
MGRNKDKYAEHATENDSLQNKVDELQKEVQELKARIEALQKELDEQKRSHQEELHELKTSHQTQIDKLQKSQDELIAKIEGDKNLLLRAQIVTELQYDMKQNVTFHAKQRRPYLENLRYLQNDLWGAKINNLVRKLYAEEIYSDETELDCFLKAIQYMKEERNDLAHVNSEKETISTLELKNFVR